MPTLHIEHSIVDFDLWKAAFDGFAQARERAGVRSHRIYQPVGESNHVVIDLDFDAIGDAQRFLEFLQTKVWSSRENAPALVGTPQVKILEQIETR